MVAVRKVTWRALKYVRYGYRARCPCRDRGEGRFEEPPDWQAVLKELNSHGQGAGQASWADLAHSPWDSVGCIQGCHGSWSKPLWGYSLLFLKRSPTTRGRPVLTNSQKDDLGNYTVVQLAFFPNTIKESPLRVCLGTWRRWLRTISWCTRRWSEVPHSGAQEDGARLLHSGGRTRH